MGSLAGGRAAIVPDDGMIESHFGPFNIRQYQDRVIGASDRNIVLIPLIEEWWSSDCNDRKLNRGLKGRNLADGVIADLRRYAALKWREAIATRRKAGQHHATITNECAVVSRVADLDVAHRQGGRIGAYNPRAVGEELSLEPPLIMQSWRIGADAEHECAPKGYHLVSRVLTNL